MTKLLKVKYWLTIGVFVLIVFGLAVTAMFLPDKDVSESERRELTKMPDVVEYSVFDREFSEKLESYNLDQFPGRELFRTVNSVFRFYGIWQMDANGLWIKDGTVFKTETSTNYDQIHYAARYYTSLIDKYLKDCNVYFSVIPDKNYFAAEENGYPHLDYDEIYRIMTEELTAAEYIDIRDTLDIGKYYRTDTHWRQPELFDTVARLGEAMGIRDALTPMDAYTPHTLTPFKGVYMYQAALPIRADDLTYLTSAYTDSAKVRWIDSKTFQVVENGDGVYTLDRFAGTDGYEVFLGGTQPLIFIENEDAKTDKELYIFRDSFGSSLTPLLTGAYKKITVIDMRYITSAFLGTMVDFTPGSDVLIINSTLTLNSASNMR